MTLQPFTPAEMMAAGPGEMPLGVRNIVAWAGALNAAASLVETLIDTPFVPASFWPLPQGVSAKDFPNPGMKHPRETPEEFALRRQKACATGSAAVLYGGALGYDPLVSFVSVYVVRGRPGLYAEAMVALVKGAGHELRVADLSDSRCVIRARRQGETDWQEFVFTMDRARKAGYTRQNPKYDADPQAMLYARCSSIACRSIAPDVLKGVTAVEELYDEPGDEPVKVSARTVKRAAAKPAAITPSRPVEHQQAPAGGGPPLPGEDEPADPPAEPASPDFPAGTASISDAQMKMLHASFGDLGITDRQDGLAYIAGVIGRDVESSKDLTKAEASLVIDQLVRDGKPAADAEDAGMLPVPGDEQ